jgi:hypothetical protein
MSVPLPERPACLLCLVQTSASMAVPFVFQGRELSRLRVACWCIDHLLESLAHAQSNGAVHLRKLDVGVLGVSVETGGPLHAVPLLAGDAAATVWKPIVTMAQQSLEPHASGSLHRWVSLQRTQSAASPNALPAPAQAVAHAHQLLRQWLMRHPDAAAPMLLYFGDGPDCAGLAGRSLTLLTTSTGAALLGYVIFSGSHEGELFAEAIRAAPEPWRSLWEESSPLRVHAEEWATAHARALFVNATPRRVNVLLQQNVARPPARARTALVPTAPAPRCTTRKLWLVKRGNACEEWEDSGDAVIESGLAAISDGASEGIFAGLWASLLVQSYLTQRPDLERLESLTPWLNQASALWKRAIDYPSLRWSQQIKVDRTGAAATLLAFRLDMDVGIAADGQVGWRAWAIGDSCLFWVRGNRLLASFPMVHSSQFVVGPSLWRSKAGEPPPMPLVASGRCQPGDLFVLATDAIAQRLLQEEEEGTAPDWDNLESMDETSWRARIETLRDARQIVNDDCTLLFLRVGIVTA